LCRITEIATGFAVLPSFKEHPVTGNRVESNCSQTLAKAIEHTRSADVPESFQTHSIEEIIANWP
jgi:hypothetical protein